MDRRTYNEMMQKLLRGYRKRTEAIRDVELEQMRSLAMLLEKSVFVIGSGKVNSDFMTEFQEALAPDTHSFSTKPNE